MKYLMISLACLMLDALVPVGCRNEYPNGLPAYMQGDSIDCDSLALDSDSLALDDDSLALDGDSLASDSAI